MILIEIRFLFWWNKPLKSSFVYLAFFLIFYFFVMIILMKMFSKCLLSLQWFQHYYMNFYKWIFVNMHTIAGNFAVKFDEKHIYLHHSKFNTLLNQWKTEEWWISKNGHHLKFHEENFANYIWENLLVLKNIYKKIQIL